MSLVEIMNSNRTDGCWALALIGVIIAAPCLRGAELPPNSGASGDPNRVLVVGTNNVSKMVPIALKGFTGETASVLKFDLEVQGFRLVTEPEARFVLRGKNTGGVEGALSDANKAFYFNKTYQGGSTRMQAHTLSDDVVEAVHGISGIGRTKIMFRMVTGKRAREIMVSDFDGHAKIALTNDNRLCGAPSWAPGNRKVFYTSYMVRNGIENPTIISHNLGGGNRDVISRYRGLNTGATVSRDGRLAFILSRDGSPDVYVANPGWSSGADPKGEQLVRITHTREEVSSPTWSPDAQWLCFATRIKGRPMLVRASSRGGPMIRVPTIGVSRPSEPSWSPDGKWIAFTAPGGGFKICVVSANGGEATILAKGEDPSWAPNSRTILFTRRYSQGGVNKRGLALLDVPTKRVKLLSGFAGSASQAAWAN